MGGRLGAKEGKLPDGVREFSSDARALSVDVAVLGGLASVLHGRRQLDSWWRSYLAVPIMSKSAAGGRALQLSPTLHSIATCRRVMK